MSLFFKSFTSPDRVDKGVLDLDSFSEGTLAVVMARIAQGSHGNIKIVATNDGDGQKREQLQYTARYWAKDISTVPALVEDLDHASATWTVYPLGRAGVSSTVAKDDDEDLHDSVTSVLSRVFAYLTDSDTTLFNDGKSAVRVEVTLEVPESALAGDTTPRYASRATGANHAIEFSGHGAHLWRAVRLATTNAAIRIPAMRVVGDLDVHTTNGRVATTGTVTVGGRTTIRTTNGRVSLKGSLHAGGDVSITTTNGSITASALVMAMDRSSRVTLRTTNAAVHVDRIESAAYGGDVDVQSTNGSIHIGTTVAAAGAAAEEALLKISAQTSNSRIAVHLANGAGFRWDAHTSNGSVRVLGKRTKEAMGGSGSGAPIFVRLRSSNGSLVIDDDLRV
ncbi:hypothetical protein BC828DRAFT_409530 [Blastocladiella britannica]|nr:hypothetical protein BC828DRAFT_409530 [Blastocladiella britannica]